jgi:hypothetical protein
MLQKEHLQEEEEEVEEILKMKIDLGIFDDWLLLISW